MKKTRVLFNGLMLWACISFMGASCGKDPIPKNPQTPASSVKKIAKTWNSINGIPQSGESKWIWNGNHLSKIDDYENGQLDYSYTYFYTNNQLTKIEGLPALKIDFLYTNGKISKQILSQNGIILCEATFEYTGPHITKAYYSLFGEVIYDKEIHKIFSASPQFSKRMQRIINKINSSKEEENWYIEYVYKNDNLMTENWYYTAEGVTYEDQTSYTYDNKINPFYNIWFFHSYLTLQPDQLSKNNMLTSTYSYYAGGVLYSETLNYVYSYDKENHSTSVSYSFFAEQQYTNYWEYHP